MTQIRHITSDTVYDVAEIPAWNAGIWECGDQRFTDPDMDQYEMVSAAQAVIHFDYPVAAAASTDITVAVSVLTADNSPVPVTDTYYVPLIDKISGALVKMLVVPIAAGVGEVVFGVATPGVYCIDADLVRPKPTASFSELPDISIY